LTKERYCYSILRAN